MFNSYQLEQRLHSVDCLVKKTYRKNIDIRAFVKENDPRWKLVKLEWDVYRLIMM